MLDGDNDGWWMALFVVLGILLGLLSHAVGGIHEVVVLLQEQRRMTIAAARREVAQAAQRHEEKEAQADAQAHVS